MKITPEILFQLMSAQTYYRAEGYEIVEVPWIVSAKADDTTRPSGAKPIIIGPDQHLIGSGEQGFIQQTLWGKTGAKVKRQTITPCFRDEHELSDTTRKYFLKLELWRVLYGEQPSPDDESYLEQMAEMAVKFHKNVLGIPCLLAKTPEGLDLQDYDGLELGSYGIRTVNKIRYIYGTGLAQPRANIASQKKG